MAMHQDSKGEFFGGSSVVAARAALVSQIEARERTAADFFAKAATLNAPMKFYIELAEMFGIAENELYEYVAKATGTSEMEALLGLIEARNQMRKSQ